MKLIRAFKKYFPPKDTNRDKAFKHAVIALGYWRRALKENPDLVGFKINLENTDSYVEVK